MDLISSHKKSNTLKGRELGAILAIKIMFEFCERVIIKDLGVLRNPTTRLNKGVVRMGVKFLHHT